MSDDLLDDVKKIASRNAEVSRKLYSEQKKMFEAVVAVGEQIKRDKPDRDAIIKCLKFIENCLTYHCDSLEDAIFWSNKLREGLKKPIK